MTTRMKVIETESNSAIRVTLAQVEKEGMELFVVVETLVFANIQLNSRGFVCREFARTAYTKQRQQLFAA